MCILVLFAVVKAFTVMNGYTAVNACSAVNLVHVKSVPIYMSLSECVSDVVRECSWCMCVVKVYLTCLRPNYNTCVVLD